MSTMHFETLRKKILIKITWFWKLGWLPLFIIVLLVLREINQISLPIEIASKCAHKTKCKNYNYQQKVKQFSEINLLIL